MTKIRRINLYAGPGSGKSTTAGWLFSQLKRLKSPKVETDWVQEVCKEWVYLDRPPTGWSDQNSIFSRQLQLEEQALRKVDVIVCDAPLLMNCFYGWTFDRPLYKHNISASADFEKAFPSLNIFLDRGAIAYSAVGRFQTEQEAKAMDAQVEGFVKSHLEAQSAVLFHYDTTNEQGILDLVKKWL
jgi:hypothetical protein